MAFTEYQRVLCRRLAPTRLEQDSNLAGEVALNKLLEAPRRSADIDLFHDTREALRKSFQLDSHLLRDDGHRVEVLRETPGFVEARVQRGAESTLIEWVHDSAFRFFPVLEDAALGLVLHPFDLATNKVLALAGRREARDWIDAMTCHDAVQHLGLLIWAACGKDPGYGPESLLGHIRRGHHWSQAELDLLDFEGPSPVAADLGARWHSIVAETPGYWGPLDPEEVGACLVNPDGALFVGKVEELTAAVRRGDLGFHHGRIGGAWPTFPDRGRAE